MYLLLPPLVLQRLADAVFFADGCCPVGGCAVKCCTHPNSNSLIQVPYSDDWAEVVKKEMEGKDLMSYVVRQTNDEKSIEFKANEPALSSIPTRDKFPLFIKRAEAR